MSAFQRLTSWLRRRLDGVTAQSTPARSGPLKTTQEFDEVYEQLSPDSLHLSGDELSSEDLAEELFDRDHRGGQFLGFYSRRGGFEALRRYGFLELLEERGFQPRIRMNTDDPARHVLRIYDREIEPTHLLIELIAGFRELALPGGIACHMLFIDWLLMQDPHTEFPPDKPPLPEQQHPGLGLFLYFGQLLRLMGTRLGCDGLLNHPAHFHNGYLYGKVMKFVDPEDEGRLQALARDLAGLDLAEATVAVDEGRVRDADGRPVEWRGTDQAMPITLRMQRVFDDEAYRTAVQRTREALRFVVT